MRNAIIKKLIEKLEQAEINPKMVKCNIAYVKECLEYEIEINNNQARHIANIKKIK